MKKKGFRILLIIFVSVLAIGYLILKPAFNYLSGYLSKSEHAKANILIVEGWLPEHALEMAYKEYRQNGYEYIVTTGMKSFKPYFNVFCNGNLIFYTRDKLSNTSEGGLHTIDIDAYSELGGENRAHFKVFINDSMQADFFADKRKRKYRVNWKGYLHDIDSVSVQFDNDTWGKFGDRNLFVNKIIVDNKITIPYINNSVYYIVNLDGKQKIINNIESNADLAKKYLITLGTDTSLITAVPAEKVRINRTLTSALAFRDWLRKTKIDVKGINIISVGTHSRRTWMTYNRILNEKYEIGIISLPEIGKRNSSCGRILKTIRETFGIIYYWLILIPY